MGRILGIDLGTTNSAVAVWDGGKTRLIANPDGSRLTPSVVSFGENGRVEVGASARHHAITHAADTVYSAKRFIGRSFEAAADDREDVPYEVVAGEGGEALFHVGGKHWSPEEISAIVLRELKRTAEASLGDRIDGVVITAPAHFNDAQRAATRKAARLAGLEVRRILNEPTAAALAYGLDKIADDERTVVVYDFGGGTFDVSVLSIGEDLIQVLSTSGDPHLGGDIVDSRLANTILEQFEARHGGPLDEDAELLQRLREAAEQAKIDLSSSDEAHAEVEVPGEGVRLTATITRAGFEEMISDLVERTLEPCRRALADAGKEANEIGEIVLAGGSTRIPFVRRRVAEFFGKEPLCTIDPDEVVARGAAVQAGIIAGELKGVVLVDVTSLSLGIETHDGKSVVVIPRNTTLPVEATRIFTTSQDDQTAVQFHVVQGESAVAAENDSLGRFVLEGLAPAKAGTSKIEVTFSIDVNGMVLVSARDLDTGAEQRVTVSVAPASGPARAARKAAAKQAAPVGAPQRPAADANLPPNARATLEEADAMLKAAGELLTRVDRASLMKRVEHLRKAGAAKAPAEEIERSREGLEKVVERVRKSKPARTRT